MSSVSFEPTIWQIVRSNQKDQYYINKLSAQLDQSIKQLFGIRSWLRTRDLTCHCNKLLYYLLTTFNGSQTLGEEYCQVLQITTNNRLPSRSTRFVLSLLYALEHSLVNKLSILAYKLCQEYFNLTHPLEEVRRNVEYTAHLLQTLNLTIFYMNGTYPDIVKRLLSIRYLSTFPRPLSDTSQSTSKLLAYLSLLQIILSLYNKYNFLKHIPDYEPHSVTSTEPHSSSGAKCLLCFSTRTNATLIECGHIFCWHCLTKWLQFKNSCPTCRKSVKSNRLVYLQNYD